MFYFILNIIVYFLLIISLYHYYSQKRITILNFLIMLFLINIYFILLYKDINIIIGLMITLIVLLIERLYNYLYFINKKEINKDKVLINRGNINFKNLIDNKYSYDKLIYNLKRKGIYNTSDIDYCALYNNDLIIFKSNIKNYPISLIVDGKIINDHLNSLKKDKKWLYDAVKNENLTIENISYAFYKDQKLYFLTSV